MKKSHVRTHLEDLIENRFVDGFDLIQVILGPRQVGKTTSILRVLERRREPSLYVAVEGKIDISTNWLDEIWHQARGKSDSCLLVIDEIQKIPNWSERIKILWDTQKMVKKSKIRLILLGSSSLQIQKGLSESLTGRFELIRAFHWNLSESKKISKFDLKQYLLYGGYPGAYQFIKDTSRFREYINSSVVETVIEKDLLMQGRVRNPALFKQTFHLLRNLPAMEISYTKLLGQLQDKGNTDLIKNYIELYEGAFLFTQIYKFTKNIKSRLSSPKIICMAPALLDFDSKGSSEFLGRCFESLVGADLIRSGLSTSYWRDGDFEIDFIVKFQNTLIGVEVKSQKRKSSKSTMEFKKQFPKAKIVYINFDNYIQFSASPEAYLATAIDI